MGRRSTKENKNKYFQCREEAGLTRSQASEAMGFIPESRIEKIEYEKAIVHPEDVIAMASAYKKPELCNYYCTHECQIGQRYVPEIKVSSLAEISLGILSSLTSIDDLKKNLIEIAADNQITEDEIPTLNNIKTTLEQISITSDSLKLWINNAIAEGHLDGEKLK